MDRRQMGLYTDYLLCNYALESGGTLTDQDAWDVATFMDSHERPLDPRFARSMQETRSKYHEEPTSMCGKTVNGHVLGGNK